MAHSDRVAGLGEVGQGLLKAKGLIALGKLQGAMELLLQMREEGLQHADIHYLLGETLRRLNRHEEALASLSESLRFEACSEYVWKSLGLVYLALQKYDKAVPLFQKFAGITVDSQVYTRVTSKRWRQWVIL